MQVDEIQRLLEAALPGSVIEIHSQDNVHFAATVTSKQFVGKTKVQQQQLVYAALGEHMTNGDIHALSLKTYAPDP